MAHIRALGVGNIVGVRTNPTSVTTSLYRLATELDRCRVLLGTSTATLGWRSAGAELALGRIVSWVSDTATVSRHLRSLAEALQRHEHQAAIRAQELEQAARAAAGLARAAAHTVLAAPITRLW